LVAPLLGPATIVLTLQNGLGNVEFHASYCGAERLLGGLCFVCINRTGPGLIEKYIEGSIRLGEMHGPARDRTRAIAALFQKAGLDCLAVDALDEILWRKLAWNIPFNGLAIAAGGVTTDVIVRHPALLELARQLMREVQAGAGALGIPISDAFLQKQIDVTLPMGPYKPSSLIDYLAGREVEVDAIWGEPARRARAAGVALLRLEALELLLRGLTDARRARSA
jgi:2-dehydropantoate 2-reductase